MTASASTYERKPFYSGILKQEVHCGFVDFTRGGPVREWLYFFHGGNGDDQQFVQAQIPDALDEKVLGLLHERGVRIVLPFIGVSFLHGKHASYFLDELLPWVEKDGPRKRHIAGLSMGGQAALTIFLRNPERFESVAAHFPTLIDFDFTSPEAVAAYCERNRIEAPFLDIILSEFKKEFGTMKELEPWDPLRLSEKIPLAKLASKKIYFDVGSADNFGLHEGCKRLHEILTRREIPHEYHLIEGGAHDGPFLVSRINALMRAILS